MNQYENIKFFNKLFEFLELVNYKIVIHRSFFGREQIRKNTKL